MIAFGGGPGEGVAGLVPEELSATGVVGDSELQPLKKNQPHVSKPATLSSKYLRDITHLLKSESNRDFPFEFRAFRLGNAAEPESYLDKSSTRTQISLEAFMAEWRLNVGF